MVRVHTGFDVATVQNLETIRNIAAKDAPGKRVSPDLGLIFAAKARFTITV